MQLIAVLSLTGVLNQMQAAVDGQILVVSNYTI
jgi:hypothetical protein